MSRYSPSVRASANALVWQPFINAVDWLRTPIRGPEILLVTGQASNAKVAAVEARLNFLFSHLGKETPEFRRARGVSMHDYLRYAGVIAVDSTAVPAAITFRFVPWVADLDYETNAHDGWELLYFGTALSGRGLEEHISSGRETFTARVRELKAHGPRPVYLFGTGPSLQLAAERSFSDGMTVVCNTIVRDAELWHRLNPDFFTAADAIYHYGDNAHARAFRADALRRLQESEGRTLFVYPAFADVIVRSEFRSVEQVLVPIPFSGHSDISVDLLNRYSLPTSGNVLSSMLLPLGCTLSTDIRLCGFDGRAPTDDSQPGFWSYSSRRAYPELIQSIRDAHPAFFDVNLPKGNEFLKIDQWHGDWLDERLTDAEERGFTFRTLHPSWTATMQARYRPDDSDATNRPGLPPTGSL